MTDNNLAARRTGKDDAAVKPAFDARLEYYRLMGKYMEEIAHAMVGKQYEFWQTSLYGLYCMTGPYMKKSESEEIETLLENCDNYSRIPSIGGRYKLTKTLKQITKLIHIYARNMMLPQAGHEETELDIKGFLAESDL